mmetsp:Transcript_1233/g.4074  ORF Transcript_1233/g.4074 Transcript_1233/m.4074 type:complete len:250 (+) Transcript_1233:1539-2288(+)
MRLKMMLGSKSSFSLKICESGLKRTLVPFFASPESFLRAAIACTAAPREKLCVYSFCPRHTVTSVVSESALTTEIPTPCNPPDTWYPLSSPPNFPPACSTVRTVSRDETPVAGCTSVGIPRPSSSTETNPDASTQTVMQLACPACTSSTPLSKTSQTKWCKPFEDVLPMYIPGRLRTGSKPFKTWMDPAPYVSADPVVAAAAARADALAAMMSLSTEIDDSLVSAQAEDSSSPTATAPRENTERCRALR